MIYNILFVFIYTNKRQHFLLYLDNERSSVPDLINDLPTRLLRSLGFPIVCITLSNDF